MVEPSGLNLMALSIKLYSTCCILPNSPYTIWMLSPKVKSKVRFFWLHTTSKVAAVSLITRLMSKLVRKRRPLLSKEFKVSIPWVSLFSRSVSVITRFKYLSCISGGMVPSRMASKKPLMEVRGERKSWDTLAIKVFWYSSNWFSLSDI